VIAVWDNPEFIRNVRAQLRPGKAIATACICAAISIVTGWAFSYKSNVATGPYGWGSEVFQVAFWLQAVMLAAGGGIACINSIHREKDQNTFDYQRVTRLTPLELTLGKLFGAPVFTYFVFLCLMPLAIFGVVAAKHKPFTVLIAYVVLLIGSIAIHTLSLLISLLTVKGSHTGAILLLLALLWGTSFDANSLQFFKIGPLGPFYAAQIARRAGWESPLPDEKLRRGTSEIPVDQDAVFGKEVRHVPVLITLDLLFTGWFLLALVRNIKRDPNYYEIYSPVQALAFALFLNLLFVAFMQWRQATAVDSQAFLLTLNTGVFSCLGLAAIRNRERMRRILRAGEGTATSWLAAVWPAPMIIAGTLTAGLLIVFGISQGRDPRLEWSANLAVLRSLFFVAWIARDLQFLQWMGLRRGKHPLVMGVIFLTIFYVCMGIVMAPLDIFSRPERSAFSAFFLPSSAVYLLDHSAWVLRPAIWVAAFLAQWVFVAVFIALQRKTIDELHSSATTPAAAPVPAHT
jgi:hypothetical protein